MGADARSEVTRILGELSRDDPQAASRLLPHVYEHLRGLARERFRHEPAGLTLQPTALVHEAYLRLVGNTDVRWDSRGHFFSAAAEAMRRILIERARKYRQPKYGGDRKRVPLVETGIAGPGGGRDDILAIDDALRKLEAHDPRRAEVVKLRYFAGLTIDQTAEVLGIAPVTVHRHWTFARTWLYQQVRRTNEADPEGP